MRTRNGTAKGVRILIFDNHPNTLRLIFRPRVNEHVDLAGHRGNVWEFVAVSIVAVATLVGMFWPLL